MFKGFRQLPPSLLLAAIAGIYVLLAKLGLLFTFVHESATAVWPPAGFALAVVLLNGSRVWPGIFIGALLANLMTTAEMDSSLGIAVGNTLEAIIGAWLVHRFAHGIRAFDSVADIFKFIVLAATISTMISASIGTASLWLAGEAGWNQLGAIWTTWWLGDMVSDLIIAPLIILWIKKTTRRLSRNEIIERALLFSGVVLMSGIVFGGLFPGGLKPGIPIFLMFPLFLWVGFRFGQRSAITAAFLMSAASIFGTLHGLSVFARLPPNTALLHVQLFIGVMAVTALGMSSVVAKQRRDEKGLRDSEERLRAILETAVEAIITIDERGLIESVNPAAEKTFGYNASELIGKNINTLMPSPYREHHDQYLKNYLQTHEAKIIGIGREVVGLRKNGETFPMHLSVSEVHLVDKRLFTGFVRDITEQRRNEETRRASEERKAAILETSLDAIITIDKEGKILEWNSASEKIFGYTRAQVFGQAMAELIIPPALRPRHYEGFKRYLATGEGPILGQRIEMTAVRATGQEFPIELSVTRITQENPPIFTAHVRDITERKRNQKYRTALLALGKKLNANSTMTTEMAARIITDIAEDLFGWDFCFIYLYDEKKHSLIPIINIDTIHGQKMSVPAEIAWELSPLANEIMEKGAKLTLRRPPFESKEVVAPSHRGRRSASLMYVPIHDGEKVIGIFSIQSNTPDAYSEENLTALQSLAEYCGGTLKRILVMEELRNTREELSRHVADLSVANKSLEGFCYSIAHDLHAPLRSLQSFSAALVEDYGPRLDPIGQDFCRRIGRSAEHMDRLIFDLLEYGHLMHMEWPLGPVDLESVVEKSIALLAEEIKIKNADVGVRQPLPKIFGNTALLEKIMINLLSNALKFVAPDTPPRIQIRAEERGGKIRVCIQDNGIGIAPEYYDRIFRVFERLHKVTDYPGTGIGLAIVKKAVERMNGTAGLESTPRKGSTFWIELPKPVRTKPRLEHQLAAV